MKMWLNLSIHLSRTIFFVRSIDQLWMLCACYFLFLVTKHTHSLGGLYVSFFIRSHDLDVCLFSVVVVIQFYFKLIFVDSLHCLSRSHFMLFSALLSVFYCYYYLHKSMKSIKTEKETSLLSHTQLWLLHARSAVHRINLTIHV